MKTLNKIFYNIIIKLNEEKKPSIKASKTLLNEYFPIDNKDQNEILDILEVYLKNFYNFCFELTSDNMLKGEINFKL